MALQALDSSVLSPSDLVRDSGERRCCRVGGRVEQIERERVRLADAMASVTLEFQSHELPPALKPGDLLLVQGRLEGDRFVVGHLERFIPCPEPTGHGQWARFRWGKRAERLHQRQALEEATRDWFRKQGFCEVRTPTVLSAPGLDSGVDALTAELGFLVTSPELHLKRMLVGGMPRVFELAPCFRREELGPRHQPQFLMLEWYRAFCDLPQILEDTESLITHLAEACGTGSSLLVSGQPISLERPFLRLTVEEAFKRHAGEPRVHELASEHPERYFEILVTHVEPALAAYEKPVFLTHYPASEAALARLCTGDPRCAERTELYLGGIELCNAYGELTGAREQRLRFEAELSLRRAEGRTLYPLDEPFLAALEEGMPPSAGNALGMDRLIALLLGAVDIGEVIAFPR